MSKELTISRAALKKIAKEAMRNSGITKEQRAKLTEVAETAETILARGWRLGDCGCLIGTAYPECFRADGNWRAAARRADGNWRAAAQITETNALSHVGMKFDGKLVGILGAALEGKRTRVKVLG